MAEVRAGVSRFGNGYCLGLFLFWRRMMSFWYNLCWQAHPTRHQFPALLLWKSRPHALLQHHLGYGTLAFGRVWSCWHCFISMSFYFMIEDGCQSGYIHTVPAVGCCSCRHGCRLLRRYVSEATTWWISLPRAKSYRLSNIGLWALGSTQHHHVVS